MDYASVSPEELVLACRQTDDVAAWREFVCRFHRLIATVALRVARRWGESSPQLIDDLVQETYLKLCGDNFRMLRKFKSDHPDAFCGYLNVVTANLVHDHFKRDRKLFWLYYRVGLTADAIAGLQSIGLSTKGVESNLLRLTRLLRDEIGRDRPKAGNNARVQ
jgi:RNA polymerase sigma-70 factor (ECF subfamily)